MVLEKWPLKCLPLFLGCAFVLSRRYVATSLSWLDRAIEATWPPPRSAVRQRCGFGEERRMGGERGGAITSRKWVACPGNAVRQPVRP